MTTANKQQMTYGACTILTDALELGSSYWAIRKNYKWGSANGEYELGNTEQYCSATIYLEEEITEVNSNHPMYGDKEHGFQESINNWDDWFIYGKAYPINEQMVIDFIVKVGTGEFSQENVPDYGQLGKTALQCLRSIYFNDEDVFSGGYDALTADSILQFILFGEVVYG